MIQLIYFLYYSKIQENILTKISNTKDILNWEVYIKVKMSLIYIFNNETLNQIQSVYYVL